jgi:uncharacterized protein YndB with AHSA1/START domain
MLAALGILGTVFLFGSSAVRCVESGALEAPELRCAFDVRAPAAEVWLAFTRTETPQIHYFDAVLQAELRPGGRWRFVTDDRARLLAGGEILELEPPRRFAQSFAAADLSDPPSRIRVELEPVTGGTRVLLVHDGFAGRTATYRRFRRAHPLALSALKSVLETGRLPVRARLYTAIFKPGMKLATVRAEPWQ